MSDTFDDFTPGLESPACGAFAISPDDGSDLSTATRAINVAQTGTVRVSFLDGSEATIFVAAGVPFPVRVVKVFATGTDASGIVGLV